MTVPRARGGGRQRKHGGVVEAQKRGLEVWETGREGGKEGTVPLSQGQWGLGGKARRWAGTRTAEASGRTESRE